MTKAIMIAVASATLASGDEINLFGYGSDTTTESLAQASATEAATFSMLGMNVISGGSGTNSLRFRDAGADGNQLAEISGTGVAEDTSNSDALSAADLFNLAYTDTGTDSTCSWVKANVELSSGYGAFHGSANLGGVVCDLESDTNYFGLAGNIATDGVAIEDNVGFKCRGYTTFEALQVRVSTNARTNDSIFTNRINAANGTGVCTFGAGVTGLVIDTGLADTIGDGQIVDVALTLDTGVEDLLVLFVMGTLKSSDNAQDSWCGVAGGSLRTGSATPNYYSIGGSLLGTLTEAQSRIKVGYAGTASNLRCYLSTNNYAGAATLKLYKNGSAVITTTIGAGGGAAWYENTSDSVTFDADDELSFEIDEGTSSNAIIRMIGITLTPTAAGTPVAVFYHQLQEQGIA